jgi:hypothetical protein
MAGLNADRECGVRPSSSEVARRYGVDRRTVSKCWNGGGPSPDDGRHGRPSGFDRHRDEIEGKAALPGVTAKGIHELLLERHAGDGPPVPGRDAFTSCLRGAAWPSGAAARPRRAQGSGRRPAGGCSSTGGGRRHARPLRPRAPPRRVHLDARMVPDALLRPVPDQGQGRPAGLHGGRHPLAGRRARRVAHRRHAGRRDARRRREALAGRARRRPGDGHRGGRGRRRALPARALPPAGEPPARRAHGVAVPPVGPGGLALVTAALGSPGGARAVLGAVPAGNGSELSDEAALAAAAGERPGEVRLYLFSSQALRELGIPPPPGARSWARETASRPARRPPSGPCRPWAGRRGGSRGGRRSPQSRRRTPGQSSWPGASRAPRTRPPRTSRPRLPSWRQRVSGRRRGGHASRWWRWGTYGAPRPGRRRRLPTAPGWETRRPCPSRGSRASRNAWRALMGTEAGGGASRPSRP